MPKTRINCGFYSKGQTCPARDGKTGPCKNCPIRQKEESKQATLRHIPVSVGRLIAREYDYDQVVIIARSVGQGGGETVVTYGRNKAHCEVAAKMGDRLKEFMGWSEDDR